MADGEWAGGSVYRSSVKASTNGVKIKQYKNKHNENNELR